MVQFCCVEIWDDFDVLKYSTIYDSEKLHQFPKIVYCVIPWIPEPSVNNKLKRREGSGSTGGFFD
jgi:hypothetical protein